MCNVVLKQNVPTSVDLVDGRKLGNDTCHVRGSEAGVWLVLGVGKLRIVVGGWLDRLYITIS